MARKKYNDGIDRELLVWLDQEQDALRDLDFESLTREAQVTFLPQWTNAPRELKG